MFDAELQEIQPLDYLRPFKTNRIDARQYQFNRLLVGGRVKKGLFGDQNVSLSALPLINLRLVTPRTFRITLTRCEFYIQLGVDILELAVGQLQVPDTIDHLTDALRDAVIIGFVESFLGQVFGVVPLSVMAMNPETLEPSLQGLIIELQLENMSNPFVGRIFIHSDFIPIVSAWLVEQSTQNIPPQKALSQVPLLTECILDEFFAAQSLVQNLQIGDLVLTDAIEGEVLIRVSGELQQKGQIMDESITLDGYLEEFEHEITASDDAATVLQQHNHGTEPNDFRKARDLFDEIPVKMTFKLHSMNVTLESLRALNAGESLPFPQEALSDIKIAVNGKPFATGELIQVENQIGVRIMQFIMD